MALQPMAWRPALVATAVAVLPAILPAAAGLEPIPDKLVVLTFDDSKASHHRVVRP